MCFICAYMYVCSYTAAIQYYEQTHAVYNAAWVVSDSYIVSYVDRSLLPFLNFLKLLVNTENIYTQCNDFIDVANLEYFEQYNFHNHHAIGMGGRY